MRLGSLRTRLVAITTVLAAVGLIIAGVATYAALRSFLLDRVDRTLEASSIGVARALTRGGPDHGPGGFGALGQAGQLTPGLYVEVRDPQGVKLFGQTLAPPGEQGRRPQLPTSIDATDGPFLETVGAAGGGSGFRVRAQGLPFSLGVLILAAPLEETDATLDRLALIEALVALTVLLSIAAAGTVAIRRGLRPLVRIDDAPGRVRVTGDAPALRQVVDNLLANVRSHTPPGTPACVGVELENGRALLRVADQGPGLDQASAERVFERFYRVDASRARSAGGSGLGLAIVHAIVEAHGGAVAVTGAEGAGATFSVTLDAVRGL